MNTTLTPIGLKKLYQMKGHLHHSTIYKNSMVQRCLMPLLDDLCLGTVKKHEHIWKTVVCLRIITSKIGNVVKKFSKTY